jgi:hypothetical protein
MRLRQIQYNKICRSEPTAISLLGGKPLEKTMINSTTSITLAGSQPQDPAGPCTEKDIKGISNLSAAGTASINYFDGMLGKKEEVLPPNKMTTVEKRPLWASGGNIKAPDAKPAQAEFAPSGNQRKKASGSPIGKEWFVTNYPEHI